VKKEKDIVAELPEGSQNDCARETKDTSSKSTKDKEEPFNDKLNKISHEYRMEDKIDCKISTWDYLKSYLGWSMARISKSKRMVFDVACKGMDDVLDVK